MANEVKPLTDDEIETLRAIVQRERALGWLARHSKMVAGWIIAIVGALVALRALGEDAARYLLGGGQR